MCPVSVPGSAEPCLGRAGLWGAPGWSGTVGAGAALGDTT